MTDKKQPPFLPLGIIGFPLRHTLSPVLHAELLRMAGLKGEYIPYEIEPDNVAKGALGAHLERFAAEGGRGLNVTIPHKVAVVPYLNAVSPEAELMGAVNTLLFEGQTLKGYNTDVTGFVRSLPLFVTESLPHRHVALLGAGGSARAVLAGLIQCGARRITLVARDAEKAAALATQAGRMRAFYGADTELACTSLAEIGALHGVTGIVNTTPVGMWPETTKSPLSGDWLTTLGAEPGESPVFVYDLIYRPLETQLILDASACGYTVFNGLDMLIHQGVAAFELWIDEPGRTWPADTIATLRETLLAALINH